MNSTAQTVPEDRSDCELISRYLDNPDAVALDELVRRHTPFVRSVCSRMAGATPTMVDDAVQVVLLVFVRKLSTLHKHPNLSGWFWRTCSFVVSDMRRRESRYESAKKPYDADVEQVATPPAMDDALPDDALVLMREAIAELPENQRDVIVLHYFQEASYESLAAERGVSVDAVRMMAMKARQRLRKVLSRKGVTLPMTALVTALEVEAKELSIADLSAVTEGQNGLPIGENADVPEGIRNTADSVIAEMERSAAKAMWGKVGAVAAGLAMVGVGTALVVSHLQSATVESATSWRIESVIGNPSVRRGEIVQTLKAGDPLCIGDTILTSSNQEVQVVSDAGDRVLLREEGEVRFEHPTSNIEHRTSKLGEGDSQVRVVYGAVVAKVKHPARFATAHAEIQSDAGSFFLMVARGMTTNGAPWSFSRIDVTEGQVRFRSSETQVSSSEFPVSPFQFAAAGTDFDGNTIKTVARKSNGRELSPKVGGFLYREYAARYVSAGFVMDANSWIGRDVVRTVPATDMTFQHVSGAGYGEVAIVSNRVAGSVTVRCDAEKGGAVDVIVAKGGDLPEAYSVELVFASEDTVPGSEGDYMFGWVGRTDVASGDSLGKARTVMEPALPRPAPTWTRCRYDFLTVGQDANGGRIDELRMQSGNRIGQQGWHKVHDGASSLRIGLARHAVHLKELIVYGNKTK